MLRYIEEKGYLYYYVFNIVDDNPKKSSITVRKERYEYGTNFDVDPNKIDRSKFVYLAYNKRSNRRIKPESIGKLVRGKWIVLLERDDQKVKDIYNEYLNQKIIEEKTKIKALKDKQNLIKNLTIEE